jgi:integrase
MPKFMEGYAARLRVPAGARDVLVFDDALPGFFIRKFASGKASYGVKYAVGTQQRRLTLGAVVPGVLAEMRKKASHVLARARLGHDVVGAKLAAAGKCTVTLGEVVPRYLAAREGELRPKSYVETQRYLERAWQPLHEGAIDAITRQTIVAVIDDLARNSGKVAADRARLALSGLYAWSIDRGYCETNPTMTIKARAPQSSRSRVLTQVELVAVWNACLDDDHGRIVRLLILTGQRKTEIGDLEWVEIDTDKRQIELPEARTKNGRAHIVPLSDEALAILSGVERKKGRDLVFGKGVGGFSGWSKAKGELDERLSKARAQAAHKAGDKPMHAWTLHDLRRSFVTHISEHGFAQPHVVEAIVNHISGHKDGVAGIYNRAAYAAEKRQALEQWGAHVAALIEGGTGKLVPLRRA